MKGVSAQGCGRRRGRRNAIALELGHDTQEGESCGSGGANGSSGNGVAANGGGGRAEGF